MDLSVQTIDLSLSVCSSTFGLFHYNTDCVLCSDRQLSHSYIILVAMDLTFSFYGNFILLIYYQ